MQNTVKAEWVLNHQFLRIYMKDVATPAQYEAMGPFHNTFTWNAADKTWTFLLEQKNKEGKWTTFATDTLRRL